MKSALALLAGCWAAAALAPAAGAARHHRRHVPRCANYSGHTLAQSRSARVFYRSPGDPADDGASYYGCLKPNGRARLLIQTNGCLHQCDSVGVSRLAGRYL